MERGRDDGDGDEVTSDSAGGVLSGPRPARRRRWMDKFLFISFFFLASNLFVCVVLLLFLRVVCVVLRQSFCVSLKKIFVCVFLLVSFL